MCQGPKDIPETVSQAGAAAVKAIGLLAKDRLMTNPCTAQADELLCNGCSQCANVCPYGAISYEEKQVNDHGIREVPAYRTGKYRALPGLRCMYRNVSVRSHGSAGLFKQTDSCGGRCDMSIERSEEFRPKIVAFCCNWCSYAGADLAGSSRLSYPADVKIIRVPVLLPGQSDVYSPGI